VWLICRSTLRNSGSDADGFVTQTKCWNQSINISQLIQPDGLYLKIVPGGAPLVRRLAFFRGKIVRGETKLPLTLMNTEVFLTLRFFVP
jgi:hypothetical protein